MKRFVLSALFVFIISPVLFADTIVFKNNCSLTNVTIIKKNNFYYYVQRYSEGKPSVQLRIPLHRVVKVIPGNLTINATSLSVNCTDFNLKQFNLRKPPAFDADSNAEIFIAALIVGAVAFDYFSDASDIQDSIDGLRELSPEVDVSSLEARRNRKFGLGVSISLSSLYLIYKAFSD